MATPNELYAMKPQETTNNLWRLVGCYYNHIPEVSEAEYLSHIESERIEIRMIKEWHYDIRRIWRLATVWFDGKPIMVIQNAGREGDDHAARFITDKEGFLAMCSHVRELLANQSNEELAALDPEAEVEGLTEFGGRSLGGYFEQY
jgi:hypothetical protein